MCAPQQHTQQLPLSHSQSPHTAPAPLSSSSRPMVLPGEPWCQMPGLHHKQNGTTGPKTTQLFLPQQRFLICVAKCPDGRSERIGTRSSNVQTKVNGGAEVSTLRAVGKMCHVLAWHGKDKGLVPRRGAGLREVATASRIHHPHQVSDDGTSGPASNLPFAMSKVLSPHVCSYRHGPESRPVTERCPGKTP